MIKSLKPFKFTLLWHQHQPYYRAGNRFLMPWAWLHATKDYLEMAQHLERHPKMHATINLVPSLIKQLEEYVSGEAVDPVVELMTKPAASLTPKEQEFMLLNFFRANQHTMIEESERYHELYEKFTSGDISLTSSSMEGANVLNEQDLRDLAVHYSLAWTGAITRQSEPFKSLIAKDKNFSEEDKQRLHEAQLNNVRNIIPLHRKLAERGQVELTTTPFYHPILPLLVDSKSARETMPDVSLPVHPFAAPEEADDQLRKARDFFKAHIGHAPKGIWPSEGSVSQDVLALIRKNGFEWSATDEGVLMNSIGDNPIKVGSTPIKPEHAKYFPWRYDTSEGPLTIFFRDHRLSDDIGFTYQSWKGADAAANFIENLHNIRSSLIESYGEKILDDACVSVILDGENCWEYYRKNGFDFLNTLYGALVEDKLVAPTTFSEAIASSNKKKLPVLPRVVAGSWINANFRIWIGHPEDNTAWDAVATAKEALDQARESAQHLKGAGKEAAMKRLDLAHEELMIAEGSDWCWWYGDDHHNAQKDIFDELFRMHLRAMYVILDKTVPADLSRPINQRPEIYELYQPKAAARPVSTEPPSLTGKLLNDSWIDIPNQAPTTKYGSMHRSHVFKLDDLRIARVGEEIIFRMIIEPIVPGSSTVRVTFEGFEEEVITIEHAVSSHKKKKAAKTSLRSVIDETVGFALSKNYFDSPAGQESGGTNPLRFYIEIIRKEHPITRIPEYGSIECTITQPVEVKS